MKKYLEIYTDEALFEAFRKKNGLTKRQTWYRLRDELQIRAWGDVYEGMQEDLDYDSPEAVAERLRYTKKDVRIRAKRVNQSSSGSVING